MLATVEEDLRIGSIAMRIARDKLDHPKVKQHARFPATQATKSSPDLLHRGTVQSGLLVCSSGVKYYNTNVTPETPGFVTNRTGTPVASLTYSMCGSRKFCQRGSNGCLFFFS